MKLLFSIVLSITAIVSSGQVRIVPVGLTDTSQNLLYIGVDNPIQITGITKDYNLAITCAGSSMHRIDNGQYIVRVNSVTDECRILISNSEPGKTLVSKVFKVRVIGVAEFNWKSGKVKRSSLLSNPFLSVGIPGCYLILDYRIISFEAHLNDGESPNFYEINGSHFSEPLINHIKKAKPGSILTLYKIRPYGGDDEFRKVPSIVIYIE